MTIEEYLQAQKDNSGVQLPVPAEVVMQLRRLTGLGVLDAKKALEEANLSEWNRRYVKALLAQPGHNLHDPIEDESDMKPIFIEVHRRVEKELEHEEWHVGFCHLYWHTQQRILQEEFGIEWFSPSKMNPSTLFD